MTRWWGWCATVSRLNKIAHEVTVILVQGKVLEIFRISTDISHRGQGVGRRLLQKMERTAAIAKCEVIILSLSTAAEGAIKFHIRHGFHEVNKIFRRFVSINSIRLILGVLPQLCIHCHRHVPVRYFEERGQK